jgi:hypothetical protein
MVERSIVERLVGKPVPPQPFNSTQAEVRAKIFELQEVKRGIKEGRLFMRDQAIDMAIHATRALNTVWQKRASAYRKRMGVPIGPPIPQIEELLSDWSHVLPTCIPKPEDRDPSTIPSFAELNARKVPS